MRSRRQIRLAVLASLLAILFGFVTIGHARTHAGDKTAEAACTFCQHATTVSSVAVQLEVRQVYRGPVAVPDSVVLTVSAVRAHGTRGPPRGA